MSSRADTRPFGRFERMIAWRYLRARRREGFISVITGVSLVGIALGVATLIIVMAVMNGFRVELVNMILGVNGHVIVQDQRGPIRDYDAWTQTVRATPGVTSATPMVEGQVMATNNQRNAGVLVRGVAPEAMARLDKVADKIVDGALADFGGDRIAIGAGLAERMGFLHAGDKITLISPEGATTPFGRAPRIKTYEIAFIFRMGMSDYDATFVFMPFAEAQLYFNIEGAASYIEANLADPDATAPARAALETALGGNAFIKDWRGMNSEFLNALAVERSVMFLILALIILVASLNIVSGLFMLVKEKGRDVAILRTMGAGRGAVMRVFLLAGGSIGVVGAVIGLGLGVLFCAYIEEIRQFLISLTGLTLFDPAIYFLARMPAKMLPEDVISVMALALSLSFLATLYPAWRAARLDPVEALRYE